MCHESKSFYDDRNILFDYFTVEGWKLASFHRRRKVEEAGETRFDMKIRQDRSIELSTEQTADLSPCFEFT